MSLSLALLLSASFQSAVTSRSTDSAGYVTTLGRDTIAVESYRRTTRHLEGEIALRLPVTVHFRYVVDWDGAGRMSRTVTELRPGSYNDALQRNTLIEMKKDSVKVTIDSAGSRTVTMHAAKAGTIPMLMTGFGNSYGLYTSIGMFSLLVDQAPARVGDSAEVPAISAVTGRTGTKSVVRRSTDVVDADYFRIGWTHLVLNERQQIQRVDALETTEQTVAVRSAPIDVRAAFKEFTSRDEKGQSLGVASPADSVRTVLGETSIAVDYSSPRLRERMILGEVVPYGKVWRTGANAATVLSMNHDLTISGVLVPAGKYSVWTVPTLDGVTLVLNSQHGQWGTQHDPSKDRFRIPMTVSTAARPRENFAILFSPKGESDEMRIEWDHFIWSVEVVSRSPASKQR